MTDHFSNLIAKSNDASELGQYMTNAKAKGRMDLYHLAFRRRCVVEGLDYKDDLERDFYTTLAAYELLLFEKHGKHQKAGYTRRMVRDKGVIKCLTQWAMHKGSTEGFDLLVARDMVELTGEFLVVKHAHRFPSDVVAAAQARLEGIEKAS